MRTPSPVKGGINEESALLPVRFTAAAVTHEQDLAVDSKTLVQLMLYSPESEVFTLQLFQPDGTELKDLDNYREDGEWPISSTGEVVKAPGWRIPTPQRGMWKARISHAEAGRVLRAGPAPKGHPDAYLFLWNDSTEKIFSHLGTYKWTKDQTVGITAQMFDASVGSLTRGRRPAVSASASTG